MKTRSTAIALATALFVITAAAGCQGIRVNNRKPVGSVMGVIVSQFSPEDKEQCTEVGNAPCAYWNSPFTSQEVACGEQLGPQAKELGANYIYVNMPKSSVGGFKTRSPKATFLKCEDLIK